MLTIARSISPLLGSVALLLTGAGLLGTLLAVRAAEEGFSDRVIGLVMSGYFAGYLLGTWGAPRLIQRIGHIRAFTMFAALAASFVLLHALRVDPLTWAALRVGTGACMVALYMIVESWLNAQAPEGRRGQVFAAYMAVNFLALAIGQWLLLLYPPTSAQPFMVVALLLCWSLVPVASTRIHPPVPGQARRLPLRELYSVSPAGVAGAFGSGFAMGAFWGLGPVAAQRMGLDTSQVASFMVAAILGGALLQWPIGRWSDRHDRQQVLAIVSASAAALALLAWLTSALPAVLLLCMFVFGGMAFTLYPVSIALANDLLRAEDMVAGAGTMLMAHGVGAALGPLVAGQLMELAGGGGLMLHFAAVLLVLAAIVGLRMRRTGPLPTHTVFAPMVRTTPEVLEMLPEAAAETTPPSDDADPQPPRA